MKHKPLFSLLALIYIVASLLVLLAINSHQKKIASYEQRLEISGGTDSKNTQHEPMNLQSLSRYILPFN